MHQRRQKREHAVSRLKSRVRELKIYTVLDGLKQNFPKTQLCQGVPFFHWCSSVYQCGALV